MRRASLHEFVTDLIETTCTDDDADIAHAVLDDEEAFGALCHHLDQTGGGTASGIEETWTDLVISLSDNELDWLASEADNPAAYLATKVA